MKVVLEFGNRGGWYSAPVILPTQKLGAKLASNIAMVLSNKQMPPMFTPDTFLTKKNPRFTWKSDTHFVCLTFLDGVPRDPAVKTLWKKDK